MPGLAARRPRLSPPAAPGSWLLGNHEEPVSDPGFVHLHVHSSYSLLEGALPIARFGSDTQRKLLDGVVTKGNVTGDDAFFLHDTLGFPIEIISGREEARLPTSHHFGGQGLVVAVAATAGRRRGYRDADLARLRQSVEWRLEGHRQSRRLVQLRLHRPQPRCRAGDDATVGRTRSGGPSPAPAWA